MGATMPVMEPMNITVLSIRQRDLQVIARARAEASEAAIHIAVRFRCSGLNSQQVVWLKARNEVLRYLDLCQI